MTLNECVMQPKLLPVFQREIRFRIAYQLIFTIRKFKFPRVHLERAKESLIFFVLKYINS